MSDSTPVPEWFKRGLGQRSTSAPEWFKRGLGEPPVKPPPAPSLTHPITSVLEKFLPSRGVPVAGPRTETPQPQAPAATPQQPAPRPFAPQQPVTPGPRPQPQAPEQPPVAAPPEFTEPHLGGRSPMAVDAGPPPGPPAPPQAPAPVVPQYAEIADQAYAELGPNPKEALKQRPSRHAQKVVIATLTRLNQHLQRNGGFLMDADRDALQAMVSSELLQPHTVSAPLSRDGLGKVSALWAWDEDVAAIGTPGYVPVFRGTPQPDSEQIGNTAPDRMIARALLEKLQEANPDPRPLFVRTVSDPIGRGTGQVLLGLTGGAELVLNIALPGGAAKIAAMETTEPAEAFIEEALGTIAPRTPGSAGEMLIDPALFVERLAELVPYMASVMLAGGVGSGPAAAKMFAFTALVEGGPAYQRARDEGLGDKAVLVGASVGIANGILETGARLLGLRFLTGKAQFASRLLARFEQFTAKNALTKMTVGGATEGITEVLQLFTEEGAITLAGGKPSPDILAQVAEIAVVSGAMGVLFGGAGALRGDAAARQAAAPSAPPIEAIPVPEGPQIGPELGPPAPVVTEEAPLTPTTQQEALDAHNREVERLAEQAARQEAEFGPQAEQAPAAPVPQPTAPQTLDDKHQAEMAELDSKWEAAGEVASQRDGKPLALVNWFRRGVEVGWKGYEYGTLQDAGKQHGPEFVAALAEGNETRRRQDVEVRLAQEAAEAAPTQPTAPENLPAQPAVATEAAIEAQPPPAAETIAPAAPQEAVEPAAEAGETLAEHMFGDIQQRHESGEWPVAVPAEDVSLFERGRSLTVEFNKRRVSKRRKAEIITEVNGATAALRERGYDPEYVKAVNLGMTGVPLPEPAGAGAISPEIKPAPRPAAAPATAEARNAKRAAEKKAERQAKKAEPPAEAESMRDSLHEKHALRLERFSSSIQHHVVLEGRAAYDAAIAKGRREAVAMRQGRRAVAESLDDFEEIATEPRSVGDAEQAQEKRAELAAARAAELGVEKKPALAPEIAAEKKQALAGVRERAEEGGLIDTEKKAKPAAKPKAAEPKAEAAETERGFIVSDEAMEKAKQNIKKAIDPSTLRAGVDPTVLKDMTVYGFGLFERGTRRWIGWTKAMKREFGNKARGLIRKAWKAVNTTWNQIEATEKQLAKRLPAARVRAIIAESVEQGAKGEAISATPRQLLRVAFKKASTAARQAYMAGAKALVESHVDMTEYANEKLDAGAGRVMAAIAQARTPVQQRHVFAAIDALAEAKELRAARKQAVDALKALKSGLSHLEEPYHSFAAAILREYQPATPTARTVRRLESMDKWAEAHPDEAALLPPGSLAKLERLTKIPIKKLSLEEASELAQRLEWWAKLSDTKHAIKQKRRAREFRADIDSAASEIDEATPKDMAPWRQAAFGFTRNLWRIGNTVADMFHRRKAPTLLRVVSEELHHRHSDAGERSVPALERVNAVADKALGGQLFSAKVERLLTKKITVAVPGSSRGGTAVNEVTMTVGELASLSMQLRDSRTRLESYKGGWNWDGSAIRGVDRPTPAQPALLLSREAVDGIEAQLPTGLGAVLDAVHSEYKNEGRRDALRQEFFDTTGRWLDTPGDRVPSHRNMAERPTTQLEFGEQLVLHLESLGSMQSRVPSKLPFLVRDFRLEFMKDNQLGAAIASGQARAIQRAAALMGQPTIKNRLKTRWGESEYQAIMNHIAYVSAVATAGPSVKHSEFVRWARKRMRMAARSYIALNPSTATIQPASVFVGATEVSTKAALSAALTVAAHPVKAVREMLAGDALMRQRYSESVLLVFGAPHSSITRAVGGWLQSGLSAIAKHTFRYGDMLALAHLWHGVQYDAKKAGWSVERARREFHRRRQNVAPSDSPVSRTRGEIAAAGNPLLYPLVMFKNYVSRMRGGLINQAYDTLHKNTPAAWGKLSKHVALFMISQALVGALRVAWRRKRRRREKINDADWTEEGVRIGAAAIHPLLGGLVWAYQSAVDYGVGQPDIVGEPHMAAVTEAVKTAATVQKTVELAMSDDGLSDKEKAKLKKNLIAIAKGAYLTTATWVGAPRAPVAYVEAFLARNAVWERGYYYRALWAAEDSGDTEARDKALLGLYKGGARGSGIQSSAAKLKRTVSPELRQAWNKAIRATQ